MCLIRFYVIINLAAWVFIIHEARCAEVIDRIVAVVNEDIITLSELTRLFNPYEEKIRALGYSFDKERKMLFKTREEILNQLVDQKLADQEIGRSNITIEESEIDDAIERIKAENFHTDEELRKALAMEGFELDEYREELKEQILRARLVNYKIKSKVIITKEDIKSYYANHADEYAEQTKFHLRNIIMSYPPLADDEGKLSVQKKMRAVLKNLKQGEAFEALAKKYSESSLADDGGDLDFFRIDELSPQLQPEIKKLKTGEFTSVLDTDQGYQIFFVEEIVTTPGKSLTEVSSEIERKLYNEILNKKYETWLTELRKRSHIKIIN